MKNIRIAALAAALASSALALARDPAGADPTSAPPPLRYDSAFSDYRPYAEVEVGSWKAANDVLAPKLKAAAPKASPQPRPLNEGAAAERSNPSSHTGHHGGGGR